MEIDLHRAGLPWEPGEQELMEEYFDKGLTVEDLAWVHRRSHGAIQSRLCRIGRLEYCPRERAYYRIDRTLAYHI